MSLKQYVREAIIRVAQTYEYSEAPLNQATRHVIKAILNGADRGWFPDWIAPSKVLKRAHECRNEIIKLLRAYPKEIGVPFEYQCGNGEIVSAGEIEIALSKGPYTMDEYLEGGERKDLAQKAMIGLAFAIEYTAKQLANEWGVQIDTKREPDQ